MSTALTYRIETQRLVIRCYNPADAAMLKAAIDDSIEHLRPWMPWINQEPESIEDKTARLRIYRGQFDLGQDYVFGIFDKEEKTLIGSTGLHTRVGEKAREIGYWINVNHIGNGYATEAVSALTKVGFEIEGLERIEIHCDPRNDRSQKIPQKLGYQLDEIVVNGITDAEGNLRDEMIWVMNKEDYQKSITKQMDIVAFDVVGEEINLP